MYESPLKRMFRRAFMCSYGNIEILKDSVGERDGIKKNNQRSAFAWRNQF